jgi:hypothetical protein
VPLDGVFFSLIPQDNFDTLLMVHESLASVYILPLILQYFSINPYTFRRSVLRFYLALINSYSIWLPFIQRLCVFTQNVRISSLCSLSVVLESHNSFLLACKFTIQPNTGLWPYQPFFLCSSEYVLFLYEFAFDSLIHWFSFIFQEVWKLFEFSVLAFAHVYI